MATTRKAAVEKGKGKAKPNGRQTKTQKGKEAKAKEAKAKEAEAKEAKEAKGKAKGGKPIPKRKDDDENERENEEDVDSEEEILIEAAEMSDETKDNAKRNSKKKAKERRVRLETEKGALETENEELKQKVKAMEEAATKEPVKITSNLVKLLNTSITTHNAKEALLYVQQYNHQAKMKKAEPMKVPA